jgi:glycine/D-amino acid oxidase-like deaminating enzyme
MMPIGGDYHSEHSFYILPQIDVAGVKVGWHGSGQTIDPNHRQPFDDSNLTTLQQLVRQRLPHLHTTPISPGGEQTCLYTNTPDSNFILDRHPDLPNVIIGTGFSGHGFKFGPVVGQILAALTLDERPPLPLDMFSINRFTVYV